ncbi:MAG: primosomal protein N' [Prevotellaceae bacterium]|nr:primosomal protein N' [Prevotellaceae bacterium]
MLFVTVILPVLPGGGYTYELDAADEGRVSVGCRVIVPFGRGKLYTAVVVALSDKAPEGDFQIKKVVDVVDSVPIVGERELRLWQWVADYYICSPGEVMKAALPSGMKLAGETSVRLVEDYEGQDRLGRVETEIVDLLAKSKCNTLAVLQKKVPGSSLMRAVRSLIAKGIVEINESVVETFRPKKETHVRLCSKYLDEKLLNELFESLAKTPRRYDLLLKLVEMSAVELAIKFGNPKLLTEVSRVDLLAASGVSASVLLAMKTKGIVEVYDYEVKRLRGGGGSVCEQLPLSPAQQGAYEKIIELFRSKEVCLLHGVTSSGKTEIYIRLIKDCLSQGKQVLYMLPEIALTTQITKRLRRIFGDCMGVYHSKFPDAERVEIWQKQMSDKPFGLILGVRSSLFLPQKNLGLVIVDEEHETSYKQQDPAPRYNGRDTAMMLARIHGAKVLLGTATPSIETFYNAMTGKYGYVLLDKRFGDIMLPKVEVVDVKDLMRRKLMKLPFSPRLEEEIATALEMGEQVILFQNRRGYAPIVECEACGWVPRCQYCDVSLTYHHNDNRLHCHYCGNSYALPARCPNCGGLNLRPFGFGTEKIEEEVHRRFPKARTVRMDLDTTRSKTSYERIIDDFSAGKTDVLIGTQMISKGLDFERVSVVGILDADAMFARPDFRSFERAFQMISQVAGRAGRRSKRGLVILQTKRAELPLVGRLVANDYRGMYESQLEERRQFFYPPFYRLIYVWFKHKDERVVDEASMFASRLLLQKFGGGVLGPDKPLVSKVSMLHLRRTVLKVSPNVPLSEVRARLKDVVACTVAEPRHHSVMMYFDVDPL